jgi:hypothetical protein
VDLLVVERHVKVEHQTRSSERLRHAPPLLREATALEVVTTVPVMQIAETVVAKRVSPRCHWLASGWGRRGQ